MIILFSTFIATEPNAFSYFIVNIQFRHSTKTKRHFYYLLILNSYMPICCKLDVDRGAFTLHCANDCLHWNAGNPIYGIDSRLFYIRHVNIVSGFVFVWVSEKYSVVTFLNFTLSLLALIKNSARKWNVCVSVVCSVVYSAQKDMTNSLDLVFIIRCGNTNAQWSKMWDNHLFGGNVINVSRIFQYFHNTTRVCAGNLNHDYSTQYRTSRRNRLFIWN